MFLFEKKLKQPTVSDRAARAGRRRRRPARGPRPRRRASPRRSASSRSCVDRAGEARRSAGRRSPSSRCRSQPRGRRGRGSGRSPPDDVAEHRRRRRCAGSSLAAATKFSDGQDDLVARPATHREQRQVERRRPVGDRERVLGPDELGEGALRTRRSAGPCSTSRRGPSPGPRPRAPGRSRGPRGGSPKVISVRDCEEPPFRTVLTSIT